MSDKNKALFKYLINLTFILYFLILITERVLSFVLTMNKDSSLVFNNGFNSFTFIFAGLSILAFVIVYCALCRDSFKLLIHPKQKETLPVNFVNLSIVSGVLLLSGMVATPNTISGIQFGAYGILIVGLLLRTIECSYTTKNKLSLWLSFIYLVCFSMAIPVMHEAPSTTQDLLVFHIVEAVAVNVLVCMFTFLEAYMFKEEDFRLFSVVSLVLVIAFNVALALWPSLDKSMINWFAIIFAIASVVIFLFGFIYSKVVKTKE